MKGYKEEHGEEEEEEEEGERNTYMTVGYRKCRKHAAAARALSNAHVSQTQHKITPEQVGIKMATVGQGGPVGQSLQSAGVFRDEGVEETVACVEGGSQQSLSTAASLGGRSRATPARSGSDMGFSCDFDKNPKK